MRNSTKIGGFEVEAIPVGAGQRMKWCVWLIELPYVRASAKDLTEAKKQLEVRWQEVVHAYCAAGEPIPRPTRRRGNKRMLDLLRKLDNRCDTVIL